jgi:hypothetical protein
MPDIYIIPMVTDAVGLINILQIAMDTCCKQHDLCRNCLHMDSCIKLWDRASEQSITKDFTSRELREFIDEFNSLWENTGNTVHSSPESN